MTFLLAMQDATPVVGPDVTLPFWRTLIALTLVLALLAGLAWVLRKGLLARRSSQALNVETALALGDRRSLVIVTVEGRRLLIGLTPGQVSLVTELKPPQTFEQAVVRATGQGVGA